MRLSDMIANMIQQMINEADGMAEIQRNELASRLGCVPSQINYVLTSRFTPEQGYIVESRRGGGGYIRITKVKLDRTNTLMHIINSIGPELDSETARVYIRNLYQNEILGEESYDIIKAALSDSLYHEVPQQARNSVRAESLKRMLIAILK